jgi:hypothetical protein
MKWPDLWSAVGVRIVGADGDHGRRGDGRRTSRREAQIPRDAAENACSGNRFFLETKIYSRCNRMRSLGFHVLYWYQTGVDFSYIFFHGKLGFRGNFRGIFHEKMVTNFSYIFHEIFRGNLAIFQGIFFPVK